MLDESMIAFKGRMGTVVFQPKQPHKRDAGMIHSRFENSVLLQPQNLFCKQTSNNVDSGEGVTHATVMRMVQPCIDRDHHIYFDNYYILPAVLKDLASEGFRHFM